MEPVELLQPGNLVIPCKDHLLLPGSNRTEMSDLAALSGILGLQYSN